MQLLRHARRRLPGKRLLQRLATERLILLDLVCRHEEIRAHGIKRPRATIRRQLRHIDLHAEQLTQRVFVFTPIQPPHRDDPLLIAKTPPRRDHHVRQIIEKIRLRGTRGLFLILWRHVARVHRIQHLLPLLGDLDIRDRQRQVIHTELALLLFRSVTAHAVLVEKGTVFVWHRWISGRSSYDRKQGEKKTVEGHRGKPIRALSCHYSGKSA